MTFTSDLQAEIEMRNNDLPFPIDPLPKWVKEAGDYRYYVPPIDRLLGPQKRIVIMRQLESGRILPEPRRYKFSGEGVCPCASMFPGSSRRAKYCRHEQMVYIIKKYLWCYRCGRLDCEIEKQFAYRERRAAFRNVSYIACKSCEEFLQEESFGRLEIGSYLSQWRGTYLLPNEAEIFREMLGV